jgi:signal transduction histidine kinase
MTENRALLLLDDDPRDAEQMLAGSPVTFELLVARTTEEASALVEGLGRSGRSVAAALLAVTDEPGAAALRRLRELDPQMLCVVVVARDAGLLPRMSELFAGAPQTWDFLCRPFSGDELCTRAARAVATWNERRHLERQLQRQDWLAKLGLLAPGVAHELANPIAFVRSNLGSLASYAERMQRYAEQVSTGELALASVEHPEARRFVEQTKALRKELKLDFVIADLSELCQQSLSGMGRMQQLVQCLRSFARGDEEPRQVDLNEALDCVLTLLHHELKQRITVERAYGSVPPLRCVPAELAQLLMRVLLPLARGVSREARLRVATCQLEDEARLELVLEGEALGAESAPGSLAPLAAGQRPPRSRLERREGGLTLTLDLPLGA